MDKRNPQELLSFACNLPTDRSNTIRIDAIERIHLALNDLLCTQYTDDLAARKKIMDRIDTLCMMQGRCSIGGLCRMYQLAKETTATLYGTKDEYCSRTYRKLLDDCAQQSDPAEELDVLQCIVYELGDIPTGNTELDYYPFFRERCTAQQKTQTPAGYWPGVSEEIALRRIALLRDNYYVFGQTLFNDTALRAYTYYRIRRQAFRQTTVDELIRLGGWYDLSCDEGMYPGEPEVRSHIGRSFAFFAETAKPYSDAWYIASIYATVYRCFVLADELPDKINPVV